MCNVTINCSGTGTGSGTGYEVIHQAVAVGDPEADLFLQIDAPAGKVVVDFFNYDLINNRVGIGADINIVTDGEGRITGVLFQHSLNVYEAYIVCVNG